MNFSQADKICHYEITVPNWATQFTYLAQTEQLATDVDIVKSKDTTKYIFERDNGVTESNNPYNRVNLFVGQIALLHIPHNISSEPTKTEEGKTLTSVRYEKEMGSTQLELKRIEKSWVLGVDDILDLNRMHEALLDRDFKEIERLIASKAEQCGLRDASLASIACPDQNMLVFMAVNAKDKTFLKSYIDDENRHLVNDTMDYSVFGSRPLLYAAMDNDYDLFATLVMLGADASKTCGAGRRDTILEYLIENEEDTSPELLSLARNSVAHRNALDIIHEIEMQSVSTPALQV